MRSAPWRRRPMTARGESIENLGFRVLVGCYDAAIVFAVLPIFVTASAIFCNTRDLARKIQLKTWASPRIGWDTLTPPTPNHHHHHHWAGGRPLFSPF